MDETAPMDVDHASGIYKLSSVLAGHEGDVRAVADAGGAQLLTASLDTKAKLWDEPSNGESLCLGTFTGHSRYIYSIAFLPPTSEHPSGLVATASVDMMVNLWSPAIHDAPIIQLVGHELTVCCVNAGHDTTVLTSSWDGTARVWERGGGCLAVLKGHEGSVLAIIAHPTPGMHMTCSADKSIKVWKDAAIVGSYIGHTDVVRDLAVLGDQTRFVSCANDGTVRIWSIGEYGLCLNTISAHGGEYIYSITTVSSPICEFATGGEDGTVCVWAGDALVEQITMPAKTVWSVASRPNGDLLVGTNDGIGRVFTTDVQRAAPTSVQDHFIEHVAQVVKAREQAPVEDGGKIGDLDMKDCKPPEALLTPGTNDGQILLIKDGSEVTAHSWSAANDRWDLVGQVSGAKDKVIKTSTAPPGWQYFDVDLNGMKLVCKHRNGENPYKTAQKFIDENEIDQNFLDQIADFVTKNTDATKEAIAAAATSRPSQTSTSYFPQPTYVSIGAAKSDGIKRKIDEFNDTVSDDLKIEKGMLEALNVALYQIVSNGPPIANVSTLILACEKLLTWPTDKRFPGLDVLRLLLMRSEFRTELFSSSNIGSVLTKSSFLKICLLEAGMSGGSQAASLASQMLALRCLCNAFGSETDFLLERVAPVTSGLKSINIASLKKPGLLALASLLLNIVVAVKKTEAEGKSLPSVVQDLLRVFDSIFDVVVPETDAEVLFRLVVAIGSLIHFNSTTSHLVMSMPNLVERIVTKCGSSQAVKVADATAQLASLLTQ